MIYLILWHLCLSEYGRCDPQLMAISVRKMDEELSLSIGFWVTSFSGKPKSCLTEPEGCTAFLKRKKHGQIEWLKPSVWISATQAMFWMLRCIECRGLTWLHSQEAGIPRDNGKYFASHLIFCRLGDIVNYHVQESTVWLEGCQAKGLGISSF